jgi:hypothetical protein
MYSTVHVHAEHQQQLEVSAQVHAPAALATGINHPYPLDERLDECQVRSERYVAQNNLSPLTRIELQFVGVDNSLACN